MQQPRQQQQGGLFAEEPVGVILSALQSALPVLLGTRPAADVPTKECAAGAAAAVGGEGGGGAGSSEADVETGQQPAASLPAAAGAADAACADDERHQKLLLLGEWLAQWLAAHVHDLVSVRRVLAGVAQAGARHDGFRAVAGRVVEVVQQRLQQRYGFALAL